MLGEKVGGTAEFEELAQPFGIARQGALLTAIGNAGAHDFVRRIEKNDGRGVAGEELAICGLEKCASAQGQHRGTRQARQDEVEMMMLDGAESAFATRGKQIGNRAVSARDLHIEIDKRAGKLEREQASDGALASAHESDEDKQRGWRILRH